MNKVLSLKEIKAEKSNSSCAEIFMHVKTDKRQINSRVDLFKSSTRVFKLEALLAKLTSSTIFGVLLLPVEFLLIKHIAHLKLKLAKEVIKISNS